MDILEFAHVPSDSQITARVLIKLIYIVTLEALLM